MSTLDKVRKMGQKMLALAILAKVSTPLLIDVKVGVFSKMREPLS